MKRIISAMLLITVMLTSSCSGEPAVTQSMHEEPVGLINRMTQKELQESKQTEFRLLSHPWESAAGSDGDYSKYKNGVFYAPGLGAIVNGDLVFNPLPPEGYKGGAGTVEFMHLYSTSGDYEMSEVIFDNYEDFKTKMRAGIDEDISRGYQKVPADEHYESIISLFDAVIAGEVETVSKETIEGYMEYYYSQGARASQDSYYWEMDDGKVEAIRDNIKEYHLYDEELDKRFVVHVTTPPAYDPDRTYPALVMTDAVWRFNNVTTLYDSMLSGNAAPQILITIGFEYDVDSWDNEVRGSILCDHKKEFLDFITDNMMPYLSGSFKIDYDSSTLFGHSQGGVFTHYAAFNYDRYDNKPFKNYVIASPTFWTPYFTCVSDYGQYKTEYGYFDRNSSYDRNLIITAGDQEDEDYKEYYGNNDSTTAGVTHLKERLDSYGVTTYQVKIYKSHHYQYVGELLNDLTYQRDGSQ